MLKSQQRRKRTGNYFGPRLVDPTPAMIRQRCAEVLANRSGKPAPGQDCRQEVLSLLAKRPGSSLTGIADALQQHTSTISRNVDQMLASGEVEQHEVLGAQFGVYFLAGQGSHLQGMEPAEVILGRFRQRAIERSRRPSRPRRLAMAG